MKNYTDTDLLALIKDDDHSAFNELFDRYWQKAYQKALEPDSGLSAEITEVVSRQQQGINASHDKIKALRDSAQ